MPRIASILTESSSVKERSWNSRGGCGLGSTQSAATTSQSFYSQCDDQEKREEPPSSNAPISNELRSESTDSAERSLRSAGIRCHALESVRLGVFPTSRDGNATQTAVSVTNFLPWRFHPMEDPSNSPCSNRIRPFPRFPRFQNWTLRPNREDSCCQSPFLYQNRPDFWNSDRRRRLLRFEFAAQFD